jgi:putative transposase
MEQNALAERLGSSARVPSPGMGRPHRIQAPDTVYHVTSRGVRRLDVYEDAVDYRKFEALLGMVVSKRGWAVHAYCQMPNHYHVVLNTPKADISDGMCWLNGVYARWFNERHGYSGHVFEARFHTELIRSNVHLLNVATYVPLNPVRASLCESPADWPWSSYRFTIGRERKPWLSAWLLTQFGRDEAAAAIEYERFVEDRRLSA